MGIFKWLDDANGVVLELEASLHKSLKKNASSSIALLLGKPKTASKNFHGCSGHFLFDKRSSNSTKN
jgi:hypothetical protein